jgi:ribose-phosphate pyrophosphokinase
MRRTKIFAGSSHAELANLICAKLGHPLSTAHVRQFANQEMSIDLAVSVRTDDVYIIQSGSDRVNDHLMEMLILVNACKAASASRITAVMPYFPYSKQSKKKKQRNAISAKSIPSYWRVTWV